MSAYSIGVDLGGTNLRVAAMDPAGLILERISVPATYAGGPEKVVEEIANLIDSVRNSLPNQTLCGVGIGIPGFIDRETGVVVGSANLPGFLGFPVRDAFYKHLGTRVFLENDANAAALGEMWLGAGRDVKELILITLGTGIGGGIVVGGEVLAGSHGMAGEIGHMTVIPDGNPCGCGNCGCLEKHASATAVAAMGRMMHMGTDITAYGVYKLATEGNPSAILIFESVGKALGIALANMINLFNFPLYLLSGGPLPAWDLFAPAMFAEVRKRSLTYNRVGARIEKALLGADAGLFGAAYLPLQRGIYSEAVACL
ncbi:MAG: ROK family protein [Bryobacteraceae bacterium]